MYSSRITLYIPVWSLLLVLVCIACASSSSAAPVDFFRTFPGTICTDSVDTRGDLNLNFIAYEIADRELYKSYFLHGPSVFTVKPSQQVLASDVNADGDTLTVSDLVYEDRVITGESYPYPKVDPANPFVQVRLYIVGDTMFMDTPRTLGALFLVFNRDLHPVFLQSIGSLDYLFDGTVTRVLIIGDSPTSLAQLHTGAVLTCANLIPPIEAQASDTLGTLIQVQIDSPTDVDDGVGNSRPAKFALQNNYPNPFNPTTTISFSLPRSTSYTLSIYSLSGHEVARFTGTAGPGVIRKEWDASACASGVYLYKLTAGSFSDTKKMLLVK